MNIYAMNDCDWVAAETPESAIAFYLDLISEKDTPESRLEFLQEPIVALADDSLDLLRFHDTEQDRKCSFREQLQHELERGQKFPMFFASTEY